MDGSCFKLNNIVTPVKVKVLKKLLIKSGYCPTKTEKLVNGFTYGFDMGYRGPLDRQDLSNNLPIRVGSQIELWNKIIKEVKLGPYAGPYANIPYKSFVQSPIGLVPKAGNKTRLIFHLSYDFKQYKSVNFYTPDDMCSVSNNCAH